MIQFLYELQIYLALNLMVVFRTRGIKTVIDTSDTGEFDIQDLGVSDKTLDSFVSQLIKVPFSDDDICVGFLRGRTIGRYDVIFFVARIESNIVVTIGGVCNHEGKDKLHDALKKVEKLAMIRSVTGI